MRRLVWVICTFAIEMFLFAPHAFCDEIPVDPQVNGSSGDLVPVLTYDEISGDISVDFGEVEAPGWGCVVVQGAYGAYQVKDYWVTSTNHYFSFHCTLTGPLTITINTPGGGTYVGQT